MEFLVKSREELGADVPGPPAHQAVLDDVLLDSGPVDPWRRTQRSAVIDIGPLEQEGVVLIDRVGRKQSPALPEERRQIAQLRIEGVRNGIRRNGRQRHRHHVKADQRRRNGDEYRSRFGVGHGYVMTSNVSMIAFTRGKTNNGSELAAVSVLIT